jgi:hypothetical protein
MSSPPWRDVIVINYCRFNIKDAGAIRLSPCMPGLGQGFCDTLVVIVLIMDTGYPALAGLDTG